MITLRAEETDGSWGLKFNLEDPVNQWRVLKVHSNYQGAKRGVKVGWRLYRWNETVVTEKDRESIAIELDEMREGTNRTWITIPIIQTSFCLLFGPIFIVQFFFFSLL